MTSSRQLPLFVREAMQSVDHDAGDARSGVCEEDPPTLAGEAERSLLALEDALSDVIALEASHVGLPQSMAAQSPSRLQELVLAPPLRYAPFFARLADLFDVSEDAAIAELTRLKDPRAARLIGLPGIQQFVVQGGPSLTGARVELVRCSPGASFPMHRHTGVERVLVLEGSYADDAGVVHRVGELREWSEGSEHSFKVGMDGPCIFACVGFGRRFDRWSLRILASIRRR